MIRLTVKRRGGPLNLTKRLEEPFHQESEAVGLVAT